MGEKIRATENYGRYQAPLPKFLLDVAHGEEVVFENNSIPAFHSRQPDFVLLNRPPRLLKGGSYTWQGVNDIFEVTITGMDGRQRKTTVPLGRLRQYGITDPREINYYFFTIPQERSTDFTDR